MQLKLQAKKAAAVLTAMMLGLAQQVVACMRHVSYMAFPFLLLCGLPAKL
jgi:hypothetical protein